MRLFLKTPIVILLFAVLWRGNATANSIANLDSTVFGSGMTYVPPADLTGWFFDSNGPSPFPVAPDPSQPWTSPENIATLNRWLSVVSDLGDDPGTLAQLTWLGDQVFNQDLALVQDAGAAESPGWTLVATGLLMIGVAAEIRRWRKRRRYA